MAISFMYIMFIIILNNGKNKITIIIFFQIVFEQQFKLKFEESLNLSTL